MWWTKPLSNYNQRPDSRSSNLSGLATCSNMPIKEQSSWEEQGKGDLLELDPRKRGE
jgi:hypothetical protein